MINRRKLASLYWPMRLSWKDCTRIKKKFVLLKKLFSTSIGKFLGNIWKIRKSISIDTLFPPSINIHFLFGFSQTNNNNNNKIAANENSFFQNFLWNYLFPPLSLFNQFQFWTISNLISLEIKNWEVNFNIFFPYQSSLKIAY